MWSFYGIVKRNKAEGVTIVIYKPAMQDGKTFLDNQLMNNL